MRFPQLPARRDFTISSRTAQRRASYFESHAREITVERRFADFEEFWAAGLLSASIRATLGTMTPREVEALKERVRRRFPSDAEGRITVGARANAVKGRVKG